MAMLTRVPGPALRPFVKLLWASDEPAHGGSTCAAARELVLPNGSMHLALRLADTPLRLYADPQAPAASAVGTAVVGGARTKFYVRDISRPVQTVGAQLEPGTAALLLGVRADELSYRHTPLDALWGSEVERMRAQLAEAPSLAERLVSFERMLFARVPRLRGLHPAIAEGLLRLAHDADVAAAARATGYSARRFSALFRESVGMPPKLFTRVRRFATALDEAARAEQPSWSALALAAGYSDQAHFNRDFREFTGLTPTRYRALAPTFAHHVPLPAVERVRFVQDGGGAHRHLAECVRVRGD